VLTLCQDERYALKPFEVTVIDALRDRIHSHATIEQFRQAPQDWTRRRKLPFATVAAMIVRGHKHSMATTLVKVFGAAPQVTQMPTPSAYAQARLKLKPELFVALAADASTQFYAAADSQGFVRRWKGRRLLGADGTYLTLPDTPETRQRYSAQTNQHQGVTCVQALGVVVYDLLNEVGLSMVLGKNAGEAALLEQAGGPVAAGDVLILDRHYLSYEVIATWSARGVPVVIRCPRTGFAQVTAFFDADERERVVRLRVPEQRQRAQRERGLPEQVRVRLVKVVLESGETEVLATTLSEQEASYEEVVALYAMRWGVETFFDRLKNIYEVERLSGETLVTIEQDIYGVFFLATLEGVLTRRATEELARESRAAGHRHPKQVNRVSSYVALVDRVVALLADPGTSAEQTLAQLQALFKTNPGVKRPGRKTERKKLKHSRRLHHHLYRKRLIA